MQESIESIATRLGDESITYDGVAHTPAEVVIQAITCLDLIANGGDRQSLDTLLKNVPQLIALDKNHQTPMSLIKAGLHDKTLVLPAKETETKNEQPAPNQPVPQPEKTPNDKPTTPPKSRRLSKTSVYNYDHPYEDKFYDVPPAISALDDLLKITSPEKVEAVHLSSLEVMTTTAITAILKKLPHLKRITVSPSNLEVMQGKKIWLKTYGITLETEKLRQVQIPIESVLRPPESVTRVPSPKRVRHS